MGHLFGYFKGELRDNFDMSLYGVAEAEKSDRKTIFYE